MRTVGLRQDKNGLHFKEWQDRARLSKIGKKRPEQSLVIKRLHKEGRIKLTESGKCRIGVATKKRIQTQGHPKGMLGKHHTYDTRELFSKMRKGKSFILSSKARQLRSDRMSQMMQKRIREKGSIYSRSNQGWFLIGGKKCYLRSGWEVVYARCLEWMKQRGSIKEWEYEPTTFWFEAIRRGVRSYTPDFFITNNDGTTEYHEVKGYMDAKSATKIKRMAKYYPQIKLIVIGKNEYRSVLEYSRLYPCAEEVKKKV